MALPEWVDHVRAEPKIDHYGEPAINITVVVRRGVDHVFRDGALLNQIALHIHDVLVAQGIELWPFVDFVSADEIEAA